MGKILEQRWQDSAVAKGYDAERFAGLVGRWFHRRQCRALSRLLQQTAPREVADVPCGTGRMLGVLRASGARVLAVDVSPAMQAQARDRTECDEGVRFVVGDARRLPLDDGAVDAAISVRFFMHLDAGGRQDVLRELARVTRRWVIVECGLDSPWQRVRIAVRSLGLRLIGRRKSYPRYVAGAQLAEEASSAGMELRRVAWTLRGLSASAFLLMERRSLDEGED